ncbi:MAG: hypothetical protein LN413_06105 [Candidatus Thermoplasmatota archaeon]|nr:hypothetical protein [Candidatus Thermoplasmatota archaeon]
MGSFLILTSVVFLAPALVLGLPGNLSGGTQSVFDVLTSGLVVLQVTILIVITPNLAHATRTRSRWTSLVAISAIQAIALSNAAFLALGLRWSGLGLEFIQAVWFAAPLALWAVLAWPRSRPNTTDSGTRPMQWVLIGFPLIFLAAALARIDFFHYTGFRVPTAVAWLLAYLPTLAGVSLAIAGWLAVRRRRSSPVAKAAEISAVFVGGLAIATITALRPAAAFILSATITFGSGYQLFTTPPPLPPLALSLFLVSLAVASLVATLVVFRLDRRPVAIPLLALAAVLSGIFPIARSVLGALVALQLLRLSAKG